MALSWPREARHATLGQGQPPVFPEPEPRFTPRAKLVCCRWSGDVGLTSDVLANAVPTPRESTQRGEEDVRPWLASITSISGAAIAYAAPAPIMRDSAWVESA